MQQRPIPARHSLVDPHVPRDPVYLEAQDAPTLNRLRGATGAPSGRTSTPPHASGWRQATRPPYDVPAPWPMPPPPVPPVPWPMPGVWAPPPQPWPTPQSLPLPQHFPFPPTGAAPPYGELPPMPPPEFVEAMHRDWLNKQQQDTGGAAERQSTHMPWLPPPDDRSRSEGETAGTGRSSSATSTEAENRRQQSASALQQARIKQLQHSAKSRWVTPSRAATGLTRAETVESTKPAPASGRDRRDAEAIRRERQGRIDSRRNSVDEEKKRKEAERRSPRAASANQRTSMSQTKTPVQAKDSNQTRHQDPNQSRKNVTLSNLKGKTPTLESALQLRVPSPNATDRRRANVSDRLTDVSSPPARAGSYIPGVGSPQYKPFVEAAKQNPKATEYLAGIEDLYRRMRASYEEFQKRPETFVRAPSAAAIRDAVHSSVPITRITTDKLASAAAPIRFGFDVQPSQDTLKLREELGKLDLQWQRLTTTTAPHPILNHVTPARTTFDSDTAPSGLSAILPGTSPGTEAASIALDFVRERKQRLQQQGRTL